MKKWKNNAKKYIFNINIKSCIYYRFEFQLKRFWSRINYLYRFLNDNDFIENKSIKNKYIFIF